jgi:hypothetical protein
MKPIRVILSPKAEEAYRWLNEKAPTSQAERSLLTAIKNKVELIKANPHYGDPIAKALIPRQYVEEYGITNLFRVELPLFWRMLYSLTNGESQVEIIAFVLDIAEHEKYDKLFGYKRK